MEAIRGAITAEENSVEAIQTATLEMFDAIMERNEISAKEIIYIIFTATADLTAAYPAKFIRTERKITDIPMMCEQEMRVDGSLERCIRALIVLDRLNDDNTAGIGMERKRARHVYLKGAAKLRPDLCK